MARGDFMCPVCGSILGLFVPAVRAGSNVARDAVVGGHLHITMGGTFICTNAGTKHTFAATGEFLLTRTA